MRLQTGHFGFPGFPTSGGITPNWRPELGFVVSTVSPTSTEGLLPSSKSLVLGPSSPSAVTLEAISSACDGQSWQGRQTFCHRHVMTARKTDLITLCRVEIDKKKEMVLQVDV